MSTVLADPVIAAAVSLVSKASLLVSLAAIAQVALRTRASAATRHAIWTLTMAGVLLLPALATILPPWPVIVRITAAAPVSPLVPIDRLDRDVEPAALTIATTAVPENTSAIETPAALPHAASAAVAIYVAGVVLMGLVFAIQWRRARLLARETDAITAAEWTQLLATCAATLGLRRAVQVRRSRTRSMPLVVGIRQPIVIVPAVADEWSDDRRQAVMLHELAHVARYDCLTQTLASAACALYWFHPGVWWAARRLRIERELACDDRVITAGTEAREYAGHLLEIAYASGPHRALALAVHMASPRQLEGRLRAALDAARNRTVPANWMRVAGAIAALAILWPLASATTTEVVAQHQPDVPASQMAQPAPVAPHLKEISAVYTEPLREIKRWAEAAVGFVQNIYGGTWEIRPSGTDAVVGLRLTELNSSSSFNVPIAQLDGLAAAQLTGAGGPVQFRIRRDAGTLVFEGVIRNGVGAGTFTFEANPAFPKELAKRGFAAPTTLEQYRLARADVGYAFIDELTRQGYAKPNTADLVRAGDHGVSTTYLREMGAEGYRLGSLEPLITLRDHGVTPTYIRGMAELGYKGLSADALQQARDHGVTPEYVRGMRDAGYNGLPMDTLVQARDHGVDPGFMQGLADAGHRNLALDEAIRVRDHGVSPEYIRVLRDRGYGSLTLDEIVNARDHGIDVQYVGSMSVLGYGGLPMADLIKMRDHGVAPRYIEELNALGYDAIPADDLILLRDHGVTADRIRAANARAGTHLTLDALRTLARRGELR